LDSKNSFWLKESNGRLALARGLLARLPEPTPPVVDGKTPGGIAYDAFINGSDSWEAAASAVLAAFGQGGLEAAITRMEAVSLDELEQVYWVSGAGTDNVAAVRARLIAAARDGQGEAVDWKAIYDESVDKHQRAIMALEGWQARAEKAESELASIVAAATRAGWVKIEHGRLDKFINDQAETLEKWADHIHPEKHDLIVKSVQDRAKAAIKEAREESLPQLRPIAEAGPVPEGCVRVYTYLFASKWYAGCSQSSQSTHFADIRLPAASQDSLPATQPAPAWQPAVGDVVQLKSGGPVMTIGKVSDEIDVFCFRGDDLMKTSIPLVCLTPAKEEQP
jgi:hypothetical protein